MAWICSRGRLLPHQGPTTVVATLFFWPDQNIRAQQPNGLLKKFTLGKNGFNFFVLGKGVGGVQETTDRRPHHFGAENLARLLLQTEIFADAPESDCDRLLLEIVEGKFFVFQKITHEL